MTAIDKEWGFDYKHLPGCEYPVFRNGEPNYEGECGEPAAVYGWWSKDGKDGWRLCEEHLQTILNEEENRDSN